MCSWKVAVPLERETIAYLNLGMERIANSLRVAVQSILLSYP